MNDIEIIKEKLKIIESLCADDCISKPNVIMPLKYAIENLTNRVKELEDTLKCTQDSWYEDTKKIEELKIRIKNIEEIEEEHRKENGKLQEKIKELEKYEEYYRDMEEVNKKFIAVDKIKEKIEELENMFDKEHYNSEYNKQFIVDCVAILEELLEE